MDNLDPDLYFDPFLVDPCLDEGDAKAETDEKVDAINGATRRGEILMVLLVLAVVLSLQLCL